MMQKLRHKFIRIALAALSITMILLTLAINVINWMNVRSEILETVDFLAQSDGTVSPEQAQAWAGKNRHRRTVLTQSAYFFGQLLRDGSVAAVDLSRTEALTREEAESLLLRAAERNRFRAALK